MSRFHSYLNSSKLILQLYHGEEPFASYLKNYFSANKKFGSKDRKNIAHLCYCFFRLGKSELNLPIEEKLLTSLFLCTSQSNEILAALKPELNEKVTADIDKKCSMLNNQFSALNIFPWINELSEGIDHEKFWQSFFVQPDLFIRIRPGKENVVKGKLIKAQLDFEILSDSCLVLSNTSKIDNVIELDDDAVVQDYSSQKTGDFLKYSIKNLRSGIALWDCCAASGGKSIMAYDIDPSIKLTVSDVRESIIVNLKKRFQKAGIKKYNSFVADISEKGFKPHYASGETNFDLIVADVPCSGSGTWSRTPEQLYYFDKKKIDEYVLLQRGIISNVIPCLRPGGSFVYITCSVFKKENEEMVEFIKEKFQLPLKRMELLKGYDKKADSMFVAVFEKL